MKPYQEEKSTFQSNGKFYNLNFIWRNVYRDPILEIEIPRLSWVINPKDSVDEKRVKEADIATPILVTKEDGRELVVDGLHRLIKAIRLQRKTLPYWRVSPELMRKAEIQIRKKSLKTSNPGYKDWI